MQSLLKSKNVQWQGNLKIFQYWRRCLLGLLKYCENWGNIIIVKIEGLKKEHPPARKAHQHTEGEEKKEKKSAFGCFQRPKLPHEVIAGSAVRDDLGWITHEACYTDQFTIILYLSSSIWPQGLQQLVREQRHGAAQQLHRQHPRSSQRLNNHGGRHNMFIVYR